MLENIQARLLNTADKKRLASNILSLVLLQCTNYALPLLTLPYLVRILGVEYFGLLAFSTSTITYFLILTNYGFNLTATSQISIHREDKEKVSEIFSSVMIIKTGLMLISFILMTVLVLSFDKFSKYREVYFSTFGIVIGQVLFPIWLFQGMERMKYITYINIAAKLFFTVCIFLFVKEQKDYVLVPIFTSLGYILAGFYSLHLAKKEFSINFKLQPWNQLSLQLRNGWHVFFSSVATSLYTVSSIFILGIFSTNTNVGYFSAADRIVQAAKGLYVPISQAIFPLVSKKVHENRHAGLAYIRSATKVTCIPMLIISLLIFLFAEQIIYLLLGEEYLLSVVPLQVMAFLPVTIALSNMLGVQTMLNIGYKNQFSLILISAAVIGIISSFFFVPHFKELGSSLIMLIVEVYVTLTMFLFLKYKLKEN